MPKINNVENKFYIRIPGERFYDNPYSKESIAYHFNLDKKTIKVEKREIGDDGFKVFEQSYSISGPEAERLMKMFTMKNGFIFDYLPKYQVADGKRFSHSVFSVGKIKVNFPDYLSNFKSMDIFKRYRYYPEPERVVFYSILRSILFMAFSKTEKPKREYPTTTKSSLAFKIDADSLTLE